jgi:hypothetical protein
MSVFIGRARCEKELWINIHSIIRFAFLKAQDMNALFSHWDHEYVCALRTGGPSLWEGSPLMNDDDDRIAQGLGAQCGKQL